MESIVTQSFYGEYGKSAEDNIRDKSISLTSACVHVNAAD